MTNNLDFGETGKVSSQGVRDEFVRQLDFFNDPVVREEVFRLSTLKMVTKCELDTMHERREEIRKIENRR